MRLLMLSLVVLAGCGMVRKPPDPDRRLRARHWFTASRLE